MLLLNKFPSFFSISLKLNQSYFLITISFKFLNVFEHPSLLFWKRVAERYHADSSLILFFEQQSENMAFIQNEKYVPKLCLILPEHFHSMWLIFSYIVIFFVVLNACKSMKSHFHSLKNVLLMYFINI